jgi:hypothetical protein
MLLTDTVLIFDSVRHSVRVLNNAFVGDGADLRTVYNEACRKIEETLTRLKCATPRAPMLPVASDSARRAGNGAKQLSLAGGF